MMKLEPLSVPTSVRSHFKIQISPRLVSDHLPSNHCGGELSAFGFRSGRTEALVSRKTDSSHRVIMKKSTSGFGVGISFRLRLFLIIAYVYLSVCRNGG